MPADAQWVTGSLSNGGEFIVIKDDLGNTMDSLRYDDNNPWPIGDATLSSPDGGGSSIILCDYNADNLVGSNWTISTSEVGKIINFQSVKATPGAANNACGPICSNSTSSFSVTECTSYEVPSTNKVYSAVGTYDVTDVIPNSCGEDSTMTITITILPELTGTHDETLCAGGSIVVNGTTYDANNLTGTEVFTNIGSNNCDSTVTINLTIQEAINTAITIDEAVLTTFTPLASYQWIDCLNDDNIIDNETQSSYRATNNGSFAVIVTLGSCSDTSACTKASILGFNNNTVFNDVSIYPVPNQGSVNVELGTLNDVTIKVFNTSGQLVYQQANIKLSNIEFDINEEPGLYFVEVKSNDKQQTYKLILE